MKQAIPPFKKASKPTPKKMEPIGSIFNSRNRSVPWIVPNIENTIEIWLSHNPHFREGFDGALTFCPREFATPFTRVGIEIEVENIAIPSLVGALPPLWNLKNDGSLRNLGAEFISSAMCPKGVFPSLALLYAWMKCLRLKPDFSWRTSIHVHLEAYKLSISEFKRLLLLYFIFEESLFQFANPGRKETNIFCTPLTRSNFYPLADFINAPEEKNVLRKTFDDLATVLRKYSALNIAHMYDFGTIEARHMRGTADLGFLSRWVSLLLKFFESSQKISDAELALDISRLNTISSYDEFTEKVFGDQKQFLLSTTNSVFLSRGISLVKEILYGGKLLKTTKFSKTSGLARFLDLQEKQSKRDKLQQKCCFPQAISVEESI